MENNSVSTAVPIHQETETLTQSTSLNEPPPAYELNPLANNTDVATAIELPPPYCLIDPSKIQDVNCTSSHHPSVAPAEIIDLNVIRTNENEQSSRRNNYPAIAAWFISGSNTELGTDCTFLMAFAIAFFFNWLGFLAVVCLVPTIAARFGAMSGFGLSVAKWITVMRYHELNNSSFLNGNISSSSSSLHRTTVHNPAQNIVFAVILFAGLFLFIRGLISYITVKNRAIQQGQTAGIFTWY